MKNLLLFLKKIRVVLIFIILEGISLYIFFSKDTYMLSRYMLVSKEITLVSDKITNYFSSYISLNDKNDELADYNARLIAENLRLKELIGDSLSIQNISGLPVVCAAKVLKNELRYDNNFIVINKGEEQGIKPGMSVINDQGIVGYVSNTSSSFSIIVSIFNKRDFISSAKLAGTSYTGSLYWNGQNTTMLQMTEMPSHIDINIGDTILTTSYSNIFFENMPVGRISDFKISEGAYYSADVEVFANIQNLNYVYVLELKDKYERDSLESVLQLDERVLK